jgi:hypothetical protein
MHRVTMYVNSSEENPMDARIRTLGRQFAIAMAISFILLFAGFRILYDSVIPEVVGLVLAGIILGFLRPRLWWISAIGLCVGIVLSQRLFPVTPSAVHVAQYGPARPPRLGEMFLLWAFPTVGTVLGALISTVAGRLRKTGAA